MNSGLRSKKRKNTKNKMTKKELLSSTYKERQFMRVYVPDKREGLINEILKDLYLLRQSVDFGSGTVDSKLKMIDKIRGQLKKLLEE
jgi:hypothetical protein